MEEGEGVELQQFQRAALPGGRQLTRHSNSSYERENCMKRYSALQWRKVKQMQFVVDSLHVIATTTLTRSLEPPFQMFGWETHLRFWMELLCPIRPSVFYDFPKRAKELWLQKHLRHKSSRAMLRWACLVGLGWVGVN